MNAAVYARKSTEQSGIADDAKSITRQVERAKVYASNKGWIVSDEHIYTDDGVSGAEFAKRAGLARLMNALTPHAPFGALIMMEESRLGREQIETAFLLKRIVCAGVRVFFYLDDRERTLDTALDKVMLSLTNFAADVERERARQRTRDVMEHKAKAGHVTGGKVFGYDNVEERTADGKRSHVRRVVNETEAAVVRRIFEACTHGAGFRRIAHALNVDGCPAPRPSKSGPRGWAPSTVRDVLRRELYRGIIVWNRTAKRDAWGQKRAQRRSENEWVRIEAPDLRIVSETLWETAHERLRGSRATYVQATSGRLWGRPSNGIESKYLLTGMAVCGQCGGALTARSRSHGQHRGWFYHCLTNVQRGRAVCDNDLVSPLTETDDAVLAAIEEDVLRPEVMSASIREAIARLDIPRDEREAERERLCTELRRLTAELARLTEALIAGGDLPSLVEAIKVREVRRRHVQDRVAEVEGLADLRGLDVRHVEKSLRSKLLDWRSLLSRNVADARQALRSLIPERLMFMPKADAEGRFYTFEGTAVLDRFLSGIVLPKALVAPTGFEPVFQP